MFEHYQHKILCFLQLSLYMYYKVVSVVKREQKQRRDNKFDNNHAQREMFLQQDLGKNNQLVVATLRKNLSDNEKAKDIISGGYPKTNICWADLVVVLLSLFIP